jgi:hypothetical protein
LERFTAPRRARHFNEKALLLETAARSLVDLWEGLAARPYPFNVRSVKRHEYDRFTNGDSDRVFGLAARVVKHEVDLLGSGPIALGSKIDWLKDYKTNWVWPPAFMRDIEYSNLERDSDVKFPWELSRVQWLIPAGQAYLLSGDEQYADSVRRILEQWIEANPYANTVNWSCTMEVALRVICWSWLFHVFAHAASWADPTFRVQFLTCLFLHGRFAERYLEYSDVNGNHCTADAAGLVFAGLFFGSGKTAHKWSSKGWSLLSEELPKQVGRDGVDYEASVPYHRLVTELFLYPALYRQTCDLPVHDEYRSRVTSMARFAAAYTRPDGSSPLLGDADDARVLPFGQQALGDHRYLIGLVGGAWSPELLPLLSGPVSELFWVHGEEAVITASAVERPRSSSSAFAASGYFVMRNARDHIFIDCAEVGLAGRGGHGHNDCLSFEAVLDGTLVASDCGAFVYTASAAERNRFRSTAFHNTPRIDGAEINRFVAPDNLWQLHNDAKPEVREWTTTAAGDRFKGSHSGYMRLSPPVRPVRTLELDHERHSLTIRDEFEGDGVYDVEIPLHLPPGVQLESLAATEATIRAGERSYRLRWCGPGWSAEAEDARVSPSYGVAMPAKRILWRGRSGPASTLTITIQPDVIEEPLARSAEPQH